MQLRDKKTYSVTHCVNKRTLQLGPNKGQAMALSGALLFTIGQGPSPRTERSGWGDGGGCWCEVDGAQVVCVCVGGRGGEGCPE